MLAVLAVAPVLLETVAVVHPCSTEKQQYTGVQAAVVAELCREQEVREVMAAAAAVVGLAAAVQGQIT